MDYHEKVSQSDGALEGIQSSFDPVEGKLKQP
jgi:hypothetical protein